jgi:hypothetical protein
MTNETIINMATMQNFRVISYRFNVYRICASIISFSNNKTYRNTNTMMAMMVMMRMMIIIIHDKVCTDLHYSIYEALGIETADKWYTQTEKLQQIGQI